MFAEARPDRAARFPLGHAHMPRLPLLALVLLLAPVRARAQTPDNKPPVLNPDTLAAAVSREYPPELIKRQLGGVVRVRLRVTPQGTVDSAQLAIPTGDTALDAAAVRVAHALRFTPARRGGEPVALWAVMPIEFRVPAKVVPNLKKQGQVQRLDLVNAQALTEAMRTRYPEGAGALGLLAHVTLRLAVDSAGLVQRVALDSTSCSDYFDRAATELAGTMRFPVRATGDTATERLTAIALTFGPDSPWTGFPGDSVRRASFRDRTKFYTVAPVLINRDEVRALLASSYPVELRDRGVGGSVLVQVRIDEQGMPERRLVVRSSGACAIDMAALQVVAGMRFSPGLLDEKPVRVWVRLPIIYKISR